MSKSYLTDSISKINTEINRLVALSKRYPLYEFQKTKPVGYKEIRSENILAANLETELNSISKIYQSLNIIRLIWQTILNQN